MEARFSSAKFIEPTNKENRSAIFKVCGQHDKRRNLVSKTKFLRGEITQSIFGKWTNEWMKVNRLTGEMFKRLGQKLSGR